MLIIMGMGLFRLRQIFVKQWIMTDVLQTNKPDLANLNRGEIGKDVLKVLEKVTPLGGPVECP